MGEGILLVQLDFERPRYSSTRIQMLLSMNENTDRQAKRNLTLKSKLKTCVENVNISVMQSREELDYKLCSAAKHFRWGINWRPGNKLCEDLTSAIMTTSSYGYCLVVETIALNCVVKFNVRFQRPIVTGFFKEAKDLVITEDHTGTQFICSYSKTNRIRV